MLMNMSIKRKLVALLLVPVLFCVACNQSQIASLTNILGTSAANIATIEGNTALATKLTTDTAAAVAAVNAWKSGSPAQEAILALNIVASDLSLFPVTDKYAALIQIAIGTVQSILALIPGSTTASVAHVSQPLITVKQFKANWNATAKAQGLTAALIK